LAVVCAGFTLNPSKSSSSEDQSASITLSHNFPHPLLRVTGLTAFHAETEKIASLIVAALPVEDSETFWTALEMPRDAG
jgi:hypothetical protein